MDDKAHIISAKLNRNQGVWGIDVVAFLAIGGQTVTATALSVLDTVAPVGGWRPLIAAAVATAAVDQQQIEIDEVMFQDYTTILV